MPWGKVDDNHYDHPKVLSIPRAIRNAADGLYWRAISRCNRTLSDGWLTDGDLDVIDSDPALVEALVTAGLWDRRADGRLRIHDYLAHNKSRAEVVKERRTKAEAGRSGGLASGRARAKQARNQKRTTREAGASSFVEPPSLPVPTRPYPSGSIEPDGATRAPDDAFDVMVLVEQLTRRPFNHREGNPVHDTLTGDVLNHGPEKMAGEYRAFHESASGPLDAAQIVFGVHNALHPLSKVKALTEAEQRDAGLKEAIRIVQGGRKP